MSQSLEKMTAFEKILLKNHPYFRSALKQILGLILCPFHPRVIAVSRKRLRSFCKKCRWQVTPKHAYTLDPTKSEWADYAAVKA